MNEGGITDSFRTITKSSRIEIKVNKSAFIANSFPVKNKEEAEMKTDEIRKEFFDARHHPYACKFGITEDKIKFSDDGEPSGTSGKPILKAIEKFKITDALIIVTRYFGGVKLGTGGLKRAYFEAAELCISESGITEKLITIEVQIECDYKYINNVMRLIEKYELKIKDNKSADRIKLIIDTRLSLIEPFKSDYTNITSGKGSIVTL